MGKHSGLLAGLMGLLGGLPVDNPEMKRPTVDDVWKKASTEGKARKRNVGNLANAKTRLKKHRWRIARNSRKVNYARNGTRG